MQIFIYTTHGAEGVYGEKIPKEIGEKLEAGEIIISRQRCMDYGWTGPQTDIYITNKKIIIDEKLRPWSIRASIINLSTTVINLHDIRTIKRSAKWSTGTWTYRLVIASVILLTLISVFFVSYFVIDFGVNLGWFYLIFFSSIFITLITILYGRYIEINIIAKNHPKSFIISLYGFNKKKIAGTLLKCLRDSRAQDK
jgi:hypothetical protein